MLDFITEEAYSTFPPYTRSFLALRISTLRKIIIALPIMRNNSTILRTAIIRTNTPNHNSIRSWTTSRIRASTQNRKLKVRSWAGKCEALVIFILVRISIVAYGFAFSVVGECCGGGVVDVGLAVVCSWEFLLDVYGGEGRERGRYRRSWSCLVHLRWFGLWRLRRRGRRGRGTSFLFSLIWKNK